MYCQRIPGAKALVGNRGKFHMLSELGMIIGSAFVAALVVPTDDGGFSCCSCGPSKHLKGYELNDALIVSGEEWNYARVSFGWHCSHQRLSGVLRIPYEGIGRPYYV